ncbi:MAG: hypothetical protein ABSB23_21900 [Bryobacteraceae bacterium]|jgi:hypothetical protein
MSSNARILSFLVLTLAALSGCSSGPSAQEAKKAARPLDKVQGKAQVVTDPVAAADAAMNAGGPSVFLRDGLLHYRLFFNTPAEVADGKQYIAEGVYAQKAIDEIGDPDQGKNGYPLQSSCERVVRRAWSSLSFDAFDADVSLLSAKVKRYPARPIFLVTRIRPATSEEIAASAGSKTEAAEEEQKDVKEVSVPPEKQSASLIEGPIVQPAPLWQPAGGTVRCKVVIGTDGKISELETGMQLCESVPWPQFRYQPPVQGGHPVKVDTEVEVRFDPRK